MSLNFVLHVILNFIFNFMLTLVLVLTLIVCFDFDFDVGFDFGVDFLLQGFDFIAVLIGLFAFSQLLNDVRNPLTARKALTERGSVKIKIEHIFEASKATLRIGNGKLITCSWETSLD